MSKRTPKSRPNQGPRLEGVTDLNHSYADAQELRGITETNKDVTLKPVGGWAYIDPQTDDMYQIGSFGANGEALDPSGNPLQIRGEQVRVSGTVPGTGSQQYVAHKYPVPFMPKDKEDTRMRYLQALGDPGSARSILGPDVGGVLGPELARLTGQGRDGKGGVTVTTGTDEFVDWMARKEAEVQKHNFWNWATRQFDTKNPADLERYNKLFPEVVAQQEQVIDHYLDLANKLHKIRLRGVKSKDDMYTLYLVDQGYMKTLEAAIPGVGDLTNLNKSGVKYQPGLLNPLRYIPPNWIANQNPVNVAGDPLRNANEEEGNKWGGRPIINQATNQSVAGFNLSGQGQFVPGAMPGVNAGARYY